MNSTRGSVLVLVVLVALLPGCGQPAVEFTDGGDEDAGLPDSGASDSGASDSGTPDSGTPDAGILDAGILDLGDQTAPRIIAIAPMAGRTNVPLATTVRATFTEPMNASTFTTTSFTLAQGSNSIPGQVGAVGAVATFSPLSNLDPGLLYTATISTAVTDLAGNALATGFSWTFATAQLVDTTPPTVLSTSPLPLAISVPITARPTATFSEPMDPASVSTTTFTLAQGMTSIAGAVSFDPVLATATFGPVSALAVSTTYTATITTGARDLAGNPLVSSYAWDFTTGACGQAPVALGSAANFAVLAGATVTSTGPTSVTGDLGLSPGSAVIGFPPGDLIGAQHAGDPIAAQGFADLTIAYDEAAGRNNCATTVSGNIGGQTLTPGLYVSTSSIAVSAGDLTLDAQGDPDGVFIFQAPSTLTTTAARQIILTGGAKASNVYWVVGTSATLGSTSVFEGTLMATESITLNTGATVHGRLLARIGAVTLDSNTVVVP